MVIPPDANFIDRRERTPAGTARPSLSSRIGWRPARLQTSGAIPSTPGPKRTARSPPEVAAHCGGRSSLAARYRQVGWPETGAAPPEERGTPRSTARGEETAAGDHPGRAAPGVRPGSARSARGCIPGDRTTSRRARRGGAEQSCGTTGFPGPGHTRSRERGRRDRQPASGDAKSTSTSTSDRLPQVSGTGPLASQSTPLDGATIHLAIPAAVGIVFCQTESPPLCGVFCRSLPEPSRRAILRNFAGQVDLEGTP